METSSARTRLLRGDQGQQHARLPPWTEVQRDFSAEDRRRPVGRVVVDEGSAAAHGVFHVRQGRGLPSVVVVLSADREGDAVTRRNDDAGGPDLDVELADLAWFERLLLVVSVERAVGQR